MFRIYLEGELHITIKKKTSDNAIQLKFSSTPQFDVGTEGKIVEQMERKIHCDHRGVYSVFQKRFGST